MKTAPKFFRNVASIVVFFAALTVANALADQNRGGDDEIGDEHLFDIDISMTPTSAAPAGSAIEVSFEAENENSATAAELEFRTRNLPAGTYSAAVTLKSDGSTVVIGSFTVDNEGEGEIEFGDEGTAFPGNIDPLNIASLLVTDANGVVLFTADLSNLTTASSMNINITAQATPGAGVPNATGTVVLHAFLAHGKVKGSLQLSGHGLPTSMQVVVAVNGVAVKSLKTSKTGDVSVKIGPKGKTSTIANGITLAAITSVTLTDRSGNVLLQVTL